MSMKTGVVCFLFVSAQITSFSASAYSENVQQNSGQNTDGLNEKTKQDLEKLKQSVEDLKKSGEERKASEELQKKVDPLMEQLKAFLKAERYDEAKKVIDQWEGISPRDAPIPRWRELVAKLEKEPDEKKRGELYLQFLANQMGELTDTLDTVDQSLTKLNQKLESLGPQGLEEELCSEVAKGNKVKVEELLGKGVSANAKDRFEDTALNRAAWQGDADILRLLLAHGADVNARGTLGSTALISAAMKGRADMVRILLDAGADVGAKAKTGVTAFSAAKKNNHEDIVELLKQSGAKE